MCLCVRVCVRAFVCVRWSVFQLLGWYIVRSHPTPFLPTLMEPVLGQSQINTNLVLVLLDLTVAFETHHSYTDCHIHIHHILLNRLRNVVGLSGTIPNQFISYLTDQRFFVNMDTGS